ncbi:MAG: hypothetical protein JSS35_06310 [Proteobacteria bacterium]|nr:hypothetical protein [Pseudomonadota bacterium]
MRGSLLFALLIATLPLAQRARAADVIGDLLAASMGAPEADQSPPPSGPADAESPRRRPGQHAPLPPPEAPQVNAKGLDAPPPEAFPTDQIPVPDRWRVIEAVGVHSRWFDPYSQNTIKGDRPIKGTQDWFFTLTGVSDTVLEPRSFPLPVGSQTTSKPGSSDNFGRDRSFLGSQSLIAGLALTKGSTAFKPPEIEVRLTLDFNYNYAEAPEKRVLSVLPSHATHRSDEFVGVQEAFVDYHLRNVSDRYDFDSIRVGIQPFSTDFRGFLFQDNQLGVRLFGDRDNNRWQYNLAWFRRLEKDTNSGLNDVTQRPRDDDVFVANLYRQDLPFPGFTSQVTLVYNRNREAGRIHFDSNGFPVRPALIGDERTRDYDVVYLGYNADGHIGRLNLSGSLYSATGRDRNSIFTNRPADIQAWFAALEPSYDLDWIRLRGSALWASGDKHPFDNKETGFDAIYENPQFGGADTSYWIRQSIPFVGGGRAIFLNGRNGVLADLRSSKDEGQSNFNNPGTIFLGLGADFDVMPRLRLTTNVNHVWFDNTQVLQTLRDEGTIPRDLGWDYSLSLIYRPKMTQNVILRGSLAVFDPNSGFRDLFTNSSGDNRYYSVLLNAILNF